MSTTVHADADFAKYAESGAYHWREVGFGLIAHNAFTAERYRRVIDSADLRDGDRVLDYGCGDGALLGTLHKRRGRRTLELHGFDPNPTAIDFADAMLTPRGVRATLHRSTQSLPEAFFDRVICTEVIEHASAPDALLADLARALKPGGRLVVTTPIRLTERPEDRNHVQEWFPGEFARLFSPDVWRVIAHDQLVPASAVEVYFWRPRFLARVPVFRAVCNLLSIYGGVNALSQLHMRRRLFMMQMIVAERAGA